MEFNNRNNKLEAFIKLKQGFYNYKYLMKKNNVKKIKAIITMYLGGYPENIIDFYKNKILFLQIFISSLPVMIVGFILVKTNFIRRCYAFRNKTKIKRSSSF